MKTRAIACFVVTVKTLSVRVRVLPSAVDVDAECRVKEGRRKRGEPTARAFFAPRRSGRGCVGTIVLPADGNLAELVPHESVHAVMQYLGAVERERDESLATLVGLLSEKILAQIHRRSGR